MSEPLTVSALLANARRDLVEGDADWLLAHVTERGRGWLYAHRDFEIDPETARVFRTLCARRRAGEPVAYLTGRKGFWSLDLAVSPATLVPRPETELLVQLALERIDVGAPARVADLGTGSGAIALALASERAQARVVATDASPEALEVARGNAAVNGRAMSIRQVTGVALGGGALRPDREQPPYIALGDPHLRRATFASGTADGAASGPDGLDAIRTIIAGAIALCAGVAVAGARVEQGRRCEHCWIRPGSAMSPRSRLEHASGDLGPAPERRRAKIRVPHVAGTAWHAVSGYRAYQTGTLG